jgi:hypothetical protein
MQLKLKQSSMRYAVQQRLVVAFLLRGAVAATDLDKARWFCEEQGCELPGRIIDKAAAAGSARMLRWLRQKGCALIDRTTGCAASRAVLQYLVDEGRHLDDHVCNDGHKDLEQLQWLLTWRSSQQLDSLSQQ